MNYKPYSALPVGAIFRDLDHADVLLMKTDGQHRALVLQSTWIDNRLYPRGGLVEMAPNECVIAVEDEGAMTLPFVRKDPVDPRRKFWKDGDTHSVGRDSRQNIQVFAGLFLYSGFGMGNYFSRVDNEVHWCNGRAAADMAWAEGLPFVHYDTAQWTRDPLLAHERQQALQQFNERTARAEQPPVSA